MKRRRSRAAMAIEVVMAMLLMSIAITTVAYVFAGSVNRISRSKVLTQAAFLSQSVMEAALLAEPFEPVPQPLSIGDPGQGFTYTVTFSPFAFDYAYYEIQVRVFHASLPPQQPAAEVATLRPYGGPSK